MYAIYNLVLIHYKQQNDIWLSLFFCEEVERDNDKNVCKFVLYSEKRLIVIEHAKR